MMNGNAITVFLADDHVMLREGLAALVADDPEIKVVGQCGNGLEVLDQVRMLCPNVVVLDITMPGLNGLDVCRELTRKIDGTAVLILTMHDDEQFVIRALESGASGYLLKEAAAGQLKEALRTVARGEIYLSPKISPEVLRPLAHRKPDPYDSLTTRERQVLQMVTEGKTSRQIAADLDVAVKTVDSHRCNLMRKLDIHDQKALLKYALRRGIVGLH